MEKSELMMRYEVETGKKFSHMQKRAVEGDVNCTMSTGYVRWLEAKAETYDRLMSGGKKTLKEWANIFGAPVAVDKNLSGIVFDEIPELLRTVEAWRATHGYVGKIPSLLIDFNGDWMDSLTLPDGWEEACSKN